MFISQDEKMDLEYATKMLALNGNYVDMKTVVYAILDHLGLQIEEEYGVKLIKRK